MKLHNFCTTLVISWLLLGCQNLNVGSFTVNHIEYSEAHVSKDLSTEVEVKLPAPSRDPASVAHEHPIITAAPKPPAGTMLCPVFRAPSFPPAPPVPIKELERIGSGSQTKIDELQRRHIEDLRSYVQHTREMMARAYAKYLSECQAFARKTR